MILKRNKKNELTINKKNIKSKSIINALNHIDGIQEEFKFEIPENGEGEKVIEVKNLVRFFGTGEKKKIVLNNLNLDIYNGENIALLGGNGAGKTTFVEILAGLNKPNDGEIKYLFNYKKNFQEKIGIQFQDSSYPPAISVKEVIKFMINIYGSKMNNDELNALIKIFGVDEYYNKRASKLSGGQQQRLNVLLALLHKPQIIFLDELSTGLDISIRTRIKRFIRDYSIENKMLVILVSHDMGEVQELCQRIVFLKNGNIVENMLIKDIERKYGSLDEFVSELL